MITGKIYANGYWDGLDAILVKDDPNNSGWVYVLGLDVPDSDLSVSHAISGKVGYFHAQIVESSPSEEEIENLGAFVYVSND